jgi:hypothetical protein
VGTESHRSLLLKVADSQSISKSDSQKYKSRVQPIGWLVGWLVDWSINKQKNKLTTA